MSRAAALQLVKSGNDTDALAAFEAAGDWYNASVMLARQCRYEEALQTANKIPDPVRLHAQSMAVLWEMGEYDNALGHIEAGLAINPHHDGLLVARGGYRLMHQDWRGWDDNELRYWAQPQREACDEYPEWDCVSSLEGKTLLVIFQDGHGDRVMYSRFLNDIQREKLPKRIVMYASHDTARLFQESFPDIKVASWYAEFGEVDCWIGMSSLGKCRFPITGDKPYLHVPEERKRKFAGYFGDSPNLRVGLVWAGNPKHKQDHTRSKSFEFFAPLLDVPGVDFYSLQFEERNNDAKGRIKELSVYCRDTADTLAAIANLDLVIGVDTGMIHFAGALGIPAWVLCFTPIDWRWGLEAERSYWYDSVRVFRNPCIEPIADALHSIEARYSVIRDPAPMPPHVITVPGRYGDMQVFAYDPFCSRSIEEYGEWSEGEMELLRKILPSDAVVVEGGANIGAHTVALSHVAKWVHAFEPWDVPRALLCANVLASSRGNVLIHPYALGAQEEQGYLQPGDPTKVFHCGGNEVFYEGTVPIPIKTLDSFNFPRVDLIKLDVEGSETAALEGATETIARCRPLLYVENDKEKYERGLIQLIDSLGYRIYGHCIPLFNFHNWKGNTLNIFREMESRMLLCVPRERYDLRAVTRTLIRVRLQSPGV